MTISPGLVNAFRNRLPTDNRQGQQLEAGVSEGGDTTALATGVGSLATGIGAIGGLVQIGLAISQFIQDEREARRENRENRAAFITSRDALGRLLGVGFDIGSQQVVGGLKSNTERLSSPAELEQEFEEFDPRSLGSGSGARAQRLKERGGLRVDEFIGGEDELRRKEEFRGFRDDQVVRQGDALAKLVPVGTILATRPGDKGLNPEILAVRERIFQLSNFPAIDDEQLGRLNEITTSAVADQLRTGPLSGDISADLGALANLGGAGQGVAQNTLNTAIVNRQFNQGGRELGRSFLEQLYGLAGATF